MRYMMMNERERRHDDRGRESSRRYEASGYGMGGMSGGRMNYEDRYEARRLPPRTMDGRFRKRRRSEYNEDHEYGYDDSGYDEGMGRRRFREDDWQTQGYVDRERERRYYDDMDEPGRRERRRRRSEYYDDDDDDGYD